jgi:hypothetical protein
MPEDEIPDPPPSDLDLDEIIRQAPEETKEIRTKRQPPPTPPQKREQEPEHPKEKSE